MKVHQLSLVGTIAIALAGCGADKDTSHETIRPVITITVPEPTATMKRSFSGLVQNAEGTGIAFEVGGRVIEVIAKDGVRYEKGDVLARLDTTEFSNQLDAARARMTEAQQGLRRAQQLFETGNASKSQFEAAVSAEQAATSNYNSVEKRVTDSTLKMPYPGTIGKVTIDAQMVVSPGQSAMTILGEGGMEFVIGVPAETVARLSVGMSASISLGSLPGEVFSAKIDSISPQVARNTTYPVTLTFDENQEAIREGLDGEAVVELENPLGKTITIPIECVATLPQADQFVWVLGDFIEPGIATVSRRVVKTGHLRENGRIEILTGLEPGEQVVSRGVHKLEENQQVTLLKEEG